MTTHRYLRFQKGDILAIVLVAVLAVFVAICFLPKSGGGVGAAEIYQNGEKIRSVSLDTPQSFEIVGTYSNTVTVRDGKIAITASNCPGEDCVHSGWIGTSGRSLVCLPNGVEVRVVSQSSGVDFVVG